MPRITGDFNSDHDENKSQNPLIYVYILLMHPG